jgi:hypothetical protein
MKLQSQAKVRLKFLLAFSLNILLVITYTNYFYSIFELAIGLFGFDDLLRMSPMPNAYLLDALKACLCLYSLDSMGCICCNMSLEYD